MHNFRKVIESLYKGRCNVIEKQKVVDEKTHITSLKDVVVAENQPCRISYSSTHSNSKDSYSVPAQTIKLFIAPEITIKESSKIVIVQNGVTCAYKRSGKPAVYNTHQEIVLELDDNYS